MSKNVTLGIMQGRLSDKTGSPLQSFPWSIWREEFPRAAKLGLETIEWLIDGENDLDNPIASVRGRKEVDELCQKYDIRISSLCAHAFIDGALLDHGLRGKAAMDHLARVMEWAYSAKIKYVILPVMESMSLIPEASRDRLLTIFSSRIAPGSEGPVLLLESDLQAEMLKGFISQVSSARLGVLYDLGNATALGFDISADLNLLNDLILEIHIKDRKQKNGPSRRLGDGDTPFQTAAQVLSRLSWRGPVVLETPVFENWRDEAEHNVHFSKKMIGTIVGVQ